MGERMPNTIGSSHAALIGNGTFIEVVAVFSIGIEMQLDGTTVQVTADRARQTPETFCQLLVVVKRKSGGNLNRSRTCTCAAQAPEFPCTVLRVPGFEMNRWRRGAACGIDRVQEPEVRNILRGILRPRCSTSPLSSTILPPWYPSMSMRRCIIDISRSLAEHEWREV